MMINLCKKINNFFENIEEYVKCVLRTFNKLYAFISYWKFDLEFIENKFLITSLYLHEMLNSVISLQIILIGTYNIDKS
jgi:hypothetical protein